MRFFVLFACLFAVLTPGCSHSSKETSFVPSDKQSQEVSEAIVYNRCIGGPFEEMGSMTVPMPDGTFYVIAFTQSLKCAGDIPASSHTSIENCLCNASSGYFGDVWVVKIDPSKSEDEQIVYNRCFGSGSYEEPNAVSISKDGKILIAGLTNSEKQTLDGDVPVSGIGKTMWVFELDPSKPEAEQIVYNRCLGDEEGDFCKVLDVIYADCNSFYLSYYTQNNSAKQRKKTLKVIKLDKTLAPERQIVYKKNLGTVFGVFKLTNLPSMFISEDGILTMAFTVIPDPENKNIPKDVLYSLSEEQQDRSNSDSNCYDIWVIRINSSLPDDRDIVCSRCFGGSDREFLSNLSAAPDGSFWFSALSVSEDGYPFGAQVKKIKPYSETSEKKGSQWIFKADLSKPHGKEVVYSRCFPEYCGISTGIGFLPDGSLLIGFPTTVNLSAGIKQHVCLVHLDPNREYDRQIVSSEIFKGSGADLFESLAVLPDGEVLLTACTDSKPGTGDVPICSKTSILERYMERMSASHSRDASILFRNLWIFKVKYADIEKK